MNVFGAEEVSVSTSPDWSIILLLILLFLMHLILPPGKIRRLPVILQSKIFPILETIAEQFTPDYNSNIIKQIPILIAVTFVKGRCGFERDGSYTTKKKDRWQMFDVGAACQTFCLSAKDHGLGTVIMGVFDEDGITELLQLPDDQELAALIALGYPDIDPEVTQT